MEDLKKELERLMNEVSNIQLSIFHISNSLKIDRCKPEQIKTFRKELKVTRIEVARVIQVLNQTIVE